ncbi:MAG: NlpC/P60 family protein [Chitinophagaceae bacterium]|nr:MAG: NlpC/P60 family protein [Chitinophagaceae bacterium]
MLLAFRSCKDFFSEEEAAAPTIIKDTVITKDSSPSKPSPVSVPVFTQDVQPQEVVNYARTLIGVPYKYGSTDPANGFDCSGFITYVFNHFNIQVPRSSVDFTNVGYPVDVAKATPGDLILFTGTDSTKPVVGHMGIVTENVDSLRFIHSTSGKQYGVTITALNRYYLTRFVKVIRIF